MGSRRRSSRRAVGSIVATLVAVQGCAWLAGVDDDLGLIPAVDGGVEAATPTPDAAPPRPDAEPAETGIFLLAGSLGGLGNLEGVGDEARLNGPRGIVFRDPTHLLVADRSAASIVEIDITTGALTRIAGVGKAAIMPDGGGLYVPSGLALADGGRLYLSDYNAIRSYELDGGTFATVAGDFRASSASAGFADGPPATARFRSPFSVALSPDGAALYVCDYSNHRVRQVALDDGTVSTLAGTGTAGHTNGDGGASAFSAPYACAVAPDGALLVGDSTSIRKISEGVVSPFVGSAIAGDGEGEGAGIAAVRGLAARGSDVFFTEYVPRLKHADALGSVTRLVGTDERAIVDGDAQTARLGDAYGIAVGDGLIGITDLLGVVRVYDIRTGAVRTVAGRAAARGADDGAGAGARFDTPNAVVRHTSGDLLVADCGNGTIRRVKPSGEVTTLAGAAEEARATVDGAGRLARFFCPYGLAYDAARDVLYVADRDANAVRRVDVATAAVTTVFSNPAGDGGAEDGAQGEGRIVRPLDLTVGDDGLVYLVEDATYRVRRLDPSARSIVTVVGDGEVGATSGVGAAARLTAPRAIVHAGGGTFFVADGTMIRVMRRQESPGVEPVYDLRDVAGRHRTPEHVDDRGAAARFVQPERLTVDGSGMLFIADPIEHAIRRLDPETLAVTTVAGRPDSMGVRLGPLPGSLNEPHGIVVEADGVMRVVVRRENAILTIRP